MENLEEFEFCLVGNIIDKHYYGENKEIKHGNKQFRSGAKVYIFPEFGGMGHENIKVIGLMGMATFTDNQHQIKKEFDFLKAIFDKQFLLHPEFKILSMGMSGDYEIAIACGSNMVRIGSSIFGNR